MDREERQTSDSKESQALVKVAVSEGEGREHALKGEGGMTMPVLWDAASCS